MCGSSKLSVTAMITIVTTIKSEGRRPTTFPGHLNLTSPFGSSSGRDNAWRPPHFHCHHHSSLIWTIGLSQVCQVLSKFTSLPLICVPLFHFAVRLQPFMRWYHSLYSPPCRKPFPFSPSWCLDSWYNHYYYQAFAHWPCSLSFFFPCHVLFIRSWDFWEQEVYAARVFITQKEFKNLLVGGSPNHGELFIKNNTAYRLKDNFHQH